MPTRDGEEPCPRCQKPRVELVWRDDRTGYQCPSCSLFVCIPRRTRQWEVPVESMQK